MESYFIQIYIFFFIERPTICANNLTSTQQSSTQSNSWLQHGVTSESEKHNLDKVQGLLFVENLNSFLTKVFLSLLTPPMRKLRKVHVVYWPIIQSAGAKRLNKISVFIFILTHGPSTLNDCTYDDVNDSPWIIMTSQFHLFLCTGKNVDFWSILSCEWKRFTTRTFRTLHFVRNKTSDFVFHSGWPLHCEQTLHTTDKLNGWKTLVYL